MPTDTNAKVRSDKPIPTIGFQVDASLKERLEQFRRSEGERSISDVCRRLLEHGLRDYAL